MWFILCLAILFGGLTALVDAHNNQRYGVWKYTSRGALILFLITLTIGLLSPIFWDNFVESKNNGWLVVVLSPFIGALIGYPIGKQKVREALGYLYDIEQKSTTENDYSQPQQAEDHFTEVEENSDFNFNSSAFSEPEKPAPRGFEGRHPDDAKYWAYVDDPNAADNERETALRAVLKRQSARKNKTGKNIDII